MNQPHYDDKELADIAAFWDVSFHRSHARMIPEGSPERTVFRIVIEDASSRYFVLEQIAPASFHAKMKIIKTLEFLSSRGLSRTVPYLAGKEGQYIQTRGDALWQMVPFTPGVPLDRSAYLYEGWRAAPLASFLTELRQASQGIPFFAYDEVFSLKKYIHTLSAQVKRREPAVFPRVSAVVHFLEQGFLGVYDTLPSGFCHGDFHPLNIVWAADDARAVIDWEFCGIKPEIYDAANMVGCLGMEHPSSLGQDLVVGFVHALRQAGIFQEVSWQNFPEFVVALRFAWLSEWLRKDDREMIALELEYMDLLIANRDALRAAWGIST